MEQADVLGMRLSEALPVLKQADLKIEVRTAAVDTKGKCQDDWRVVQVVRHGVTCTLSVCNVPDDFR